MAWADITDTETTSGKPARASVVRRLRDNLLAALLGTDPNAPKVQHAAIDDTVAAGDIQHYYGENGLLGSDFPLEDGAATWGGTLVYIRKSGTIRVRMAGVKSASGATAWLRIYKNGVAVGTQRNLPYWNSGSYTPQVWEEDISVQADDYISIQYYQSTTTAISFCSYSYRTSSPFSPFTIKTDWSF